MHLKADNRVIAEAGRFRARANNTGVSAAPVLGVSAAVKVLTVVHHPWKGESVADELSATVLTWAKVEDR